MTITGVLTFILVIGVLVFFHELGHFLFAKLFKMTVEDFSLGFGPRMVGVYHNGSGYKVRWGEGSIVSRASITGKTDYNIRVLPIGGFVKIKGMEIEEESERRLTGTVEKKDEDTGFETTTVSTMKQEAAEVSGDDADGYNSRPISQRFWVIFGGPLFSFALGWLALCLIGMTFGIGNPIFSPVIEQVVPGKPAAIAGIKAGDKVLSIDGTPIKTGDQMVDILHQSAGKALKLEIQAPKEAVRTVTVTPTEEADPTGKAKSIGMIGVSPVAEYRMERVGIGESFSFGTRFTGLWFKTIAGLFSKPKELGSSVGGPVAIFQASQTASKEGGSSILSLLGTLSLSLGLFNLFPIPVLDGGHLALMLLEAIRRRKLTAAQTNQVLHVGVALIMVLAAVVLFKDVRGYFVKKPAAITK